MGKVTDKETILVHLLGLEPNTGTTSVYTYNVAVRIVYSHITLVMYRII